MCSYQKILVPTDGSVDCESGLLQACRIAITLSAVSLDLLFLLEQPNGYSFSNESGAHSILLDEIMKEMHQKAEVYCRQTLSNLAAIGNFNNIKLNSKILESNEISNGIMKVAQDSQYDLILMTTHGRKGLSRMLYGSTTESVIRKTSIPVISIHTDFTNPGIFKAPTKILVPIDGSEYSTRALKEAITFINGCRSIQQSQIYLLHIIEPEGSWIPSREDEEYVKKVVDLANGNLADAERMVREEGIKVEALLDEGNVINLIVKHAESANLVVMGTRGRTGLQRLMFGSVTEGVLREITHIPIMTVHPMIN